jgi:hypothetical protein
MIVLYEIGMKFCVSISIGISLFLTAVKLSDFLVLVAVSFRYLMKNDFSLFSIVFSAISRDVSHVSTHRAFIAVINVLARSFSEFRGWLE